MPYASDSNSEVPFGKITDVRFLVGGTPSLTAGGGSNNAFVIDPPTGRITVNNSAEMVYATYPSVPGPSFTLDLRVTDGGGASTDGTIYVNLMEIAPAPGNPTAVDDNITTVNEGDTGVVLDVLANDLAAGSTPGLPPDQITRIDGTPVVGGQVISKGCSGTLTVALDRSSITYDSTGLATAMSVSGRVSPTRCRMWTHRLPRRPMRPG